MDGLEYIIKNFDLEIKHLDTVCQPEALDKVAGEIIDEWYLVGRALKVSEKKLKSIEAGLYISAERKAVSVLDAWAEENGSRATYLLLAEALYRRKKVKTIEILCEEVNLHMKLDDINMTSVLTSTSTTVSHQPGDNQQQPKGNTARSFKIQLMQIIAS